MTWAARHESIAARMRAGERVPRSKVRNPKTNAEWQEAVDLAAALRAIAGCKMYGLIEGGPEINLARCDAILERGRAMGVRPSAPVPDLAVEMVRLINGSGVAESPEVRQ